MLLLFACGDDSGSARVDAPNGDDGGGSGSDGSLQFPCDYTESADATNASVPNAEPSGLTLGATRIAICGKLDTGHFDASNDLIDADGIIFTVAADTDVIVHLVGSGINNPDRTVVQILKQNVNELFGFGIVEGDHATLVYRLPAGEYVAAVYGLDTAATSASIDYQILIGVDTARCPAKTGTPDHPEGTDGGANDVVDYSFTSNPESTLSDSTTDAPETTGITVAPAGSYLITGTQENVDPNDDYMDRDTFAFTTGASTTQMSLRLNWPGTNIDLDYRVYPQSTTDPEAVVGGLDMAQMESEFETFAVKPNTTYWLWVAEEDGSTAPATYSATLCGETFTP